MRAPRLLRPSGAFFRLAFGALLVIPASAQGAELVSNIGQDNSSTIVLATNEMAMGFETGPTPGGYTLGSIEVEFVTASDVALQSVTATLWTADEDDSDIPGSSIATLSNPASLSEEGASTSTDATLSALSLGTGVTLDPAFASATTDYRAWVANPVDSVTVTATKNDEAATVAIAGDDDAATPGTATLSLDPGRNTVKVTVTAEDGNTTEAYTVTLVREAAAPSAHPALLLNALMTVGERDGFPGYNALLSPTIGAITGADFEVDSTRYELGLLGEFGATAPTHYNPETVVACFAASANPPDAVRNALVVLISGKTFRFDASTAITTSDCYEWPRAAGGLGWSYGEIVAVALELDVTPPALSSVAVTSMPTAMGDTYGVGEKIRFTVTFNGPVRVTGAPHFEFSLGPSGSDVDKEAALESGDGTTALVFAYTVLAADMDDNGIRVRDHTRTIKLDAGETIRDLVSNTVDAVLVHIGLGTLGGHKVDGSLSPPPPPPPPTQVPANWGLIPSGLSEGDAFRLLIVTSTRQNAEDTAIADYNSVVRGDVSSTGHADIRSYSAGFKILGCTRTTSAIANTYTGSTDTAAAIYWLNGAKVADNYADLYDGNWDSNRPKYPGGTNAPVSGAESRVFTGCLESGASSGSNYLGADRVNQGYPASAGFEIDALPTAKTDLRRFFGLSGIFRVGAAAPTVSSVAVTSTPTAESDTYGVGELIRFTVTFTDEVEVSASRPHFEFSLDGTDTRAAYERGSGTTALVFVYTVLAADMDDNGIWIGNQTRTIKLDDGEYIRAVDDQVSAFLNHAGPGRQSEHKVDGSLTPTGHSNAIGAPAISGTARVGETLTAAIGNIADADGLPVNFPGDYSFQWIREDSDGSNAVDIPGATLSTYALVAADEGKKIKVRVSFQDDDGNDEELTSAAYPASKAVAEIYSAVMGAGNPSPGYVGFSSGQAGSLNPNSFTDDGTGYTIVYLAVLRGELILEFNKEPPSGWTLHVGDAAFPFDDASRIRGNRELHWANSGLTWSDGDTVNVRLTTLPAMSTNTPATGAPAITGTAQVNKTLTADMNDIADADGLPATFPDDYTFQWIRVDADGESNREEISGAIARTYALVAADEGKKIKVRVSFTDKASNGEARTSAAYPSGMETVAEACEVLWCATLTVGNLSTLYGYSDVPPVDIGSLSPDSFTRGTAVVGVPYVAYNSGTGGQLSLQIRRISGTTPADGLLGSEELALTLGSETFTFTAGLGSQLVFAFDAAGLSWDDGDTVEVSLAIANRPATGVPTISGAAQVGQTLTAARGSIDDTDGPPDTFPDDYTFQWIRVDADGESNREEISGAIARTYALIAADEGKKIKVRVSFTDKASNGEARTSAAYPSGMETVAEACEVLWCATLTVGNLSTLYGYSDLPPVDIGSLSPDSFTRGTAVVGVPYVAYNSGTGGQLSLQIRRISGTTPADGLLGSEELALTLGSETFTFTAGLGSQLVFAFDAAGLSWNEGDTVKVSLAVAAANNPATGAPAISGTARAGETLTAAKDTIADADGLPATFPDDYTLQWVRVDADGTNPVNIGTDSGTYALVAADVGKKIKVEVSFQDDDGNDEEVTSEPYPSGAATVGAANNPATGAPAISGTARAGETLTAAKDTIADADGLPATFPDDYTLQWVRVNADGTNPVNIGTDSGTYALVAADVGKKIKVEVSFQDDDGNDEEVTSEPYPSGAATVGAANNPATGAPAISGTARAGETLTAAKDTIADADGLPATFPDDYTLQWVRVDADGESNSVDIGTDSSTYMLVAADEGKKIKVRVRFQDNEGNDEALTGAAYPSGMETVAEACEVLWCATLTVGNLSTLYGYSDLPPVDIGSLSPDSFTRGTAVVGVPYVAYNSGTGGQLSLQIRRISGTTPADGLLGSEELALTLGSETFTFTAGLGSQLVFAFDAAGLSWNEGDTVKVSLAVAAANNPATGAPAISGTARAGETLTAAKDTIADADGLPATFPDDYTLQWVRVDADGTNPVNIGTDSGTYALVAADVGKKIKVEVSFQDDDGNDEEVTSEPYPSGAATVGAANNPATGAPAISGTARAGETLTAAKDTIADADGLPATFPDDYTLQWVRVDADGTNPVNIGTDSGTYALVAADVGKKIKVEVSFQDDDGNDEEVTSEPYPSGAATVGAANNPATGAPAISGTARAGETLTAAKDTIADADGLPATFPDDYTLQWVRVDADGESNSVDIGTDSSTYMLVAADEGKKIKVRVRFQDNEGNDEALTGAAYPSGMETVAEACEVLWCATLTVGNLSTLYGYSDLPPVDIGSLSPDSFTRGTAVVGVPYVAYNSGTGGQLSLQIRRISGTTPADGLLGSEELALTLGSETFTFTAGLGSQLVFAFDAAGLSWNEGDRVKVFLAVAAANNPATGAPAISGTARAGETLTAAKDTIADADGLPATFPDDYTLQWVRVDADGTNPVNIGTDSGTYALVAADVGKKIKVEVSFQDDDGNDEEVTSEPYPSGAATVGAANNPATGAPAISGTARAGETLTAAKDTIADADGLPATFPDDYTLQWVRVDADGTNPVNIGTDSGTYALVAADVGKKIKVEVSFQDDDGNDEEVTSEPYPSGAATVGAANNPATGAPAISGTARAGETLTAAKDNIADADGLPATFPDDYTLQWVRVDADGESNSVDIGTDSSTYMLVAADEGKKIKVRVRFQDNEGNGEARTSAAYPSGMETVAEACEVLWCATLTVGNLSTLYGYSDLPPVDIGSLSPDSFTRGTAVVAVPYVAYNSGTGGQLSLQIRRISGTTPADGLLGSEELALTLGSETFTFTAGLGSQLVFAFDAAGLSWNEGDTVKVSLAVATANNPATGVPAISGTARAGETLTAAKDNIADADGLPATFPDDYTLQWVRVNADGTNPVNIGTDSGTYALVAADVGKKIKVEVSFQDDDGNDEEVTSEPYPSGAATVGVANTPATGAPAISGTARAGETLTAATTGIMDDDGLKSATYSYQWIREDSDGTNPTPISGATSSTYMLAAEDEGKRVKVKVTFTDDASNDEELTSAAYPSGEETVAPANNAPVITTTSPQSVPENTTAAVTLAATDADTGSTFTWSKNGGADAGKFNLTTAGVLTFAAAPDFEVPADSGGDNGYVVIVRVSDGTATDDLTLTVNVTDADEKPATPAAPGVTATAGSTTSLDVSWTAPNRNGGPAIAGYNLQYRAGTSGSFTNGPQNVTGTSVAITTGLSAATSYEVQVRALNGETPSDWSPSGTGSTGSPANNAPVITTTSPQSVPENTTAAVTLAATDADTGSTFTWSKNGGADAGKFNLTTAGVLTFAAAPDFEVPADSGGDNGYVVIVRVSDGTATDDLTLTVNVTDADEKPATPAAPGVTATAGSTTSLDVSWTAPNRNGGPAIAGYNLQYRAGTSGSFTNGPQNVTGTSVAITTGLSAATSYEVQVRALNGETPSDWSPSGTGSTGSPANNAPVITTTSPQSVPENTTAAVTLAATDADTGSTFTWSKNGGADAGKFNLTTAGVLTFAAAPDFEVPADSGGDNGYVVIVRVSDGTATDDLTLTVNVTDADEKPATPAAPGVTATAGSTTSLDVSWTAPNRNGGPAIAGYNLQYRAGTSGSFTNGPQNVTGTSVAITTGLSAATSYEVQVRALNGETPSDWSPSGTGSTGSPANNAPVITTTSPQSVPENTTAAVTLAATDADTGSTFTWSKNGGADAGKFNLTTAGVLTFAAAPDFEVPADSGGDNGYVVIVRVSDGTATDDLTLTVNVTDADEKPATPAAPGVTATAGSTTSLDVSWTAPNRNGGPAIAGYNLQYRAGTSGSFTNGPQNVTGTSVAITTGLSAATSYEVQVRALNGETPSDWSPSGTGSTGSPANNAPVITTTSPQSVPENTTAAVTLAATDADTGSTFTWSKNGGADAGKFNLTTAGVLTFAAAPDFEVPADSGGDNGYVVIVRVSDGTATDDLTLTVNVTDADEKPATPAAPGVTATAGSTTSLDVSWTAPNRNGGPAIAGYNLQYRAGTSGSFTNGPQNVTGTSVAITTGLSAATSYEVQVRALNGETPSDWSPSGTGSTGSPANNAPVITTTSPQSVPENTTAAVTLAATDADTGSTFTWSKNGGADAGKFNLTTAGVLTFAAAPDFEVPADSGGDNGYVVIVRVSDGTATDDLTLTVNVTDADEKPATPAAPGVTATAGSTTSLDVSWTAPNRNGGPAIAGYNLQYRAGTSGSFTNGPQNVTGTSVAITTGLSAATSYEVQVRALNGETPSDWSPSGTGSTGSPANNAPVITTTSPQSVPENTTAAVTLAATDADTGSTFTWSKNGGADAGKFNLTTAGVLTFAAAPDFEVPADSGGDNGYVVIVRVSDGTATDDLTLTVNVTDADEKPATPAAPGVTATAGSTTSLDVSWTAPNRNGGPAIAGYNLQYRAGTSGSFTNGPQNVTGTSVAITTGLSAATSYEVQVRALNGETPSDWSPSGTGSTGSPANNPASGAPTISGTARVGGALTAARGSIDDDDGLPSTFPDDYAFQWVREDSGGTNPMDIDGATSSTYTLDANDEGKRVKVKVTFTDGGSNDEALTSAAYPSIGTVDPANNAPAFTEGASATRSVAENTAAGANIGDPVEATDTDTGDTLTYTLRGTDAAAFAIVSTSGQLRTKAALNHETKSSHSVTVAVSDGNGGSDSITVTINVTDVDEQPATPAAPSVGSTPGTTTSLTVNWTAPDANGGPAIAGYDLQYRAGTSGNFMDGPQNVTGTSAAIAGLNADTSYLVRVRALNGETPSEWSAPGAGVTATAAGVTLGATSLDVGEGVSATYTVVLEAPPTGPVTVTPRVVGNTEVTVSGALTFTVMNWQDAQEVTVSADHDADDEDDTATVSHAVTGANYARVTAGDVEVTVLDDEGSFGTIDAHFTAVRGGADDVAGWGGPLPDNHFGEPFQLAVGFRRAGDYVLLTGRCQPLTWEQYQTLTVCARGPAPAQWLGPNGALRVTGATVRLIDTAYHRIRMELTPTAPARDVTVTVQPLPCPAARAMCAGSNGLSKRLNLTVSGVTGPPEAPGNVTVEPIDYHEDGGNDLRVSFDLDPVGVDYLIQWQRAGKAWASPGEREGWRGQKRTGRDSDVIFDVVAGQAYDVRVRWENDRGPGPWTTVYNVGGTGQGSNRGAPEVERIERHGDQVWIFFDRDLDTGVARHNKLTPQFGVHYSESAPAGLPDTLAGHSVNLTEIVKTRHAGACTSNGQACRIVRLTLNPVTRGGTEYDGPADEETVSVSYWKSYYEPENLRAAGEWHSVPHVAEFSRVVADPVGTTPALSVADAEGREGTNPSIRFAVRLAPAATGEVTVRYYTSSGTATVRADYEETTGTLTFATGEWRKIVEVPIVDDEEKDSGETFFFHLFEASGAQIGDDRATGTILNREDEDDTAEDDTAEDDPVEDDPVEDDPVEDDPVEEEAIEKAPPPPALSVADASVDEKENDATLLDFAVTLNRAPSTTVTVDYATADGAGANPATAGQDYHSRSGTLTFTRGQQRRIVSIAVLDDSHDEGAETLTMTLSNASGATIADGKATGTINNSDPMPKGWLARFGRTASVHTVDAIRERLTGGPRRPEENHFTVGGRRVDQLLNEFRSAARGDDAKETGERAAPDRRLEDESTWDRMDRLKAESMGWWAAPGRAAPGGIGLAAGEFAGGAPRMGGPAPTGLSSSGASPSGSNDAGLASAGLPSAARAGLENLVSAGLSSAGLLSTARPFADLLSRGREDWRALLMGSSFDYSRTLADGAGTANGLASWSAWGRAAETRFSGADGKLSIDGAVATATVGADARWGRWLAGVAVSHSFGEGAYSHPTAAGGDVTSRLTSINPYANFTLNERLSVWGAVGYGVGELSLQSKRAGDAIETGLESTMAAFGGRGVFSRRGGGFELAVVSDALFTNTVSDAATGLMGAEGAASRLRLMLEGSGSMALSNGAVLRPTLEAGLRYDGGDAETGAGVEIGGGVAYTAGRVSVEVNVRGLLAHEDAEYEEWGFSGSLKWQPNEDGRGWAMEAGSSWGDTASGVNALWSRQDASGIARGAGMDAARRFHAQLGYGLEGRRGRALWVPFVGAESSAGQQAYRMGVKLTSGANLEAGLELGRRTDARGVAEDAIQLQGSVRW